MGFWIAMVWFFYPYEWQKILDIRIIDPQGFKFRNQQYFRSYARFSSENQSECSTSGLVWEKYNFLGSSLPFEWQNIPEISISGLKKVKLLK